MLVVGVPIYFLYKSIIQEMSEKGRKRFHRYIKIFGITFFVIFYGEVTVSLIIEHKVNKQLGFSYATPDTPEGEIFEITRVDAGKIMEKAGLKPFDRVQMSATWDLYRLLIKNQGKEVTFSVIRDKKEVKIYVKVPNMELPLRKISITY